MYQQLSFVGNLDVSDEDTVPSSLKFNRDGTKMFVLVSEWR